MTQWDDVMRAIAHGLVDACALSVLLALAAAAIARLPGVDPATRSRAWSAAAVVPLLVLVAALLGPLVTSRAVDSTPQAGAATSVLLADPLDALRRGAQRYALRSGATAAAPASAATAFAFPFVPLACALWFAVAALRIARVAHSLVRAHRLAALARPFADAPVAPDLRAARAAIRVSGDVETPVAVGITRRTVVMPARLAAHLSPPEFRAVVLHELAHLRRRDDWVFLAERLAAAVLWIDPIVHLATNRSAGWREIACDAAAARVTGGRACASALWRSAGAISAPRPHVEPALLSGGILVDRVEALLRPAPVCVRRTVAATTAVALLAVSAGAVAIVRAPAYALPGAAGLRATGSMRTPRASFAAVKLRDGRVLVAGGMIANQNFTAAAELYDPVRGVFDPTGSLQDGRVGLSGSLLADGRVLVAGGWTSRGVTASTEVYDPATGRFTSGPPMRSPRAGHTATTLRDGSILFAGGAVANNTSTAAAELYDARRGVFEDLAPMRAARTAHTATLLRDGRVLVAGGVDAAQSLRSTELYDPLARRFVSGPAMNEPRSKQGAQLLPDGSVLVVGGGADNGWASRLDSTERYDPAANRFVRAATMRAHRFKLLHSIAPLGGGDVLVAGGDERVEIYETAHDRFRTVDGTMDSARNLGAAISLDDGSVLIAGGYANVDPLPTTATAQRYR